MLVIQTAGKRAGEVVDMPMGRALELMRLGRVRDARDSTQLADPNCPAVDHRTAHRAEEALPSTSPATGSEPQSKQRRKGR